jgi:hypothetical protein
MVHLDLVDDLDGDFQAAMLLDRIRFRAGSGWWEATYSELMSDTRLSEHQVKRCLKKLRDVGFLESKRVSPYDPTQMFRLVVCEECPETTVREDFTRTSGGDSPALPTKNSKELSKNPPISPHLFDEFWKAYPRKKSKGRAEVAWKKALKDTDPALIIHGAIQFSQWCIQDAKEPEFIPYPATWLNGKGWLDERDPTPVTKSEARMQGHIALIEELWETENGYPQDKPLQLEG